MGEQKGNASDIRKRIAAILRDKEPDGNGLTMSEITKAAAFSDADKKAVASSLKKMESDGEIEVTIQKGKKYYRAMPDSGKKWLSPKLKFQHGKRYQGEKYSFDIPDSFEYKEDEERDFIAWLPKSDAEKDVEDSPLVLYASSVTPFKYEEPDSIHSREMLGMILYMLQEQTAEAMVRLQIQVSGSSRKGRNQPFVFPIDTGEWIFSCMALGMGTAEQHYYISVYLGEGQNKQFRVDLRDAHKAGEKQLRLFLAQLMQHFHYNKTPIALYDSLLAKKFTADPLTEQKAKKWSSTLDTELNEMLDMYNAYCQKSAGFQRICPADIKTVRERYRFDIENYTKRIEELYAATGAFITEVSAKNRGNRSLLIPYRKVMELMDQCDHLSLDLGDHHPITCKIRNIDEVKKLWETEEIAALQDASPVGIRKRLEQMEQDLPALNAEWEKERDEIQSVREQEQEKAVEEIAGKVQPEIDQLNEEKENSVRQIDSEITALEKSNQDCEKELSGLSAIHFKKRSSLNQLMESNQEKIRTWKDKKQESIDAYDKKLAKLEEKRRHEQDEKIRAIGKKYITPEKPEELIKRIRKFIDQEERRQKLLEKKIREGREKILSCLADNKRMTCTEIASQIGETVQKTAYLLDRLQEQDLVSSAEDHCRTCFFLGDGSYDSGTLQPLSDADMNTAFAKDRTALYRATRSHSMGLNDKSHHSKLKKLSDLRILQIMLSLADGKDGKLIYTGDDIRFRHL